MGTRLRTTILTAVAAIAVAAGGTALAADGTPNGHTAFRDAVAQSLGVSVDTLKKAILDDAGTRIDKAVKDGDLDADEAADMKDDLAAAPERAIRLTTATGVARNLGTTKAKLDDAFRAARKAELTARIDQALKDGWIDEDDANQLNDRLAEMTLPGYKGGHSFGGCDPGGGHGFGHRGGPFGGDGPGKGMRGGLGPAVTPA
ncbi:MAG: hypothetical protein FJW96_09390 [Actinobacteria bacterium]|nr:hypothetical protein [Actinomycetota bacterium]